jgi:hypothetical protein
MTDWDSGWCAAPFAVDGTYTKSYPLFIFSGWMKADGSSGNNRQVINWTDADGWITNSESPFLPHGTSDWTKVSLAALPPKGATHGQLYLRSDANTGTVWFDDLSVTLESLPVTVMKWTSVMNGLSYQPVFIEQSRHQWIEPGLADSSRRFMCRQTVLHHS